MQLSQATGLQDIVAALGICSRVIVRNTNIRAGLHCRPYTLRVVADDERHVWRSRGTARAQSYWTITVSRGTVERRSMLSCWDHLGGDMPFVNHDLVANPNILPSSCKIRAHSMAGRDPPYFLNTQEDRGTIVAVVTFTFVVVATLANTIPIWIRQRTDGALGLDDALLIGANVSQAHFSAWDK